MDAGHSSGVRLAESGSAHARLPKHRRIWHRSSASKFSAISLKIRPKYRHMPRLLPNPQPAVKPASLTSERGLFFFNMERRTRIIETAKAVAPFVQLAVGFVLIVIALYQFLGSNPPAEYVKPMLIIFVIGVGSFVGAIVFALRFHRDKAHVAAAVEDRAQARARLDFLTRRINEILAIDSAHCVFLYRHPKATKEQLQERFGTYISETLSQIRDLFNAYTKSECAVCVKLLNLDSEIRTYVEPDKVPEGATLPYVYTLARDPFSRPHRAHIDQTKPLDIYRFDFNTGLAKAMEGGHRGYWFANDLLAMGPNYRNIHGDWFKYYTATCTVVLRTPHVDEVNQALGFLCIDNMTGGFDDNVCRQTVEILSNIVYYTLWMYISRIERFSGGKS